MLYQLQNNLLGIGKEEGDSQSFICGRYSLWLNYLDARFMSFLNIPKLIKIKTNVKSQGWLSKRSPWLALLEDNTIMQFLLTADVAAHLGCTPENVRTIKFRKKEELIEGTHWIQSEDNKTLWTPRGYKKLAEFICPGKDVPQPFETAPLQDETPSFQPVTPPYHGETAPLQALADRLAMASIEHELQLRIEESRRRILTAPTESDALALAQSIDRIGKGLGLLKASQAMLGAIQAVNAQAALALGEGRNDG